MAATCTLFMIIRKYFCQPPEEHITSGVFVQYLFHDLVYLSLHYFATTRKKYIIKKFVAMLDIQAQNDCLFNKNNSFYHWYIIYRQPHCHVQHPFKYIYQNIHGLIHCIFAHLIYSCDVLLSETIEEIPSNNQSTIAKISEVS